MISVLKMKPQLAIGLIFCIALCLIAHANSESYIEVDEHGNEFEVKRFHIQGRQLDGGRSQCVITRRKRNTATASSAAIAASINIVAAADNEDADGGNMDDDMAEKDAEVPVLSNKRRLVQLTHINGIGPAAIDVNVNGDVDGNDDDDEGDDNQQEEEVVGDVDPEADAQYIVEPAQINKYGISVPLGYPLTAASAGAVTPVGANGIVVVQSAISQSPPVNADNHGLFALVTPSAYAEPIHYDYEYDEDDYDDDDEYFTSEDKPVTTTAIWSTGFDDAVNERDRVQPAGKPTLAQVTSTTTKKPKKTKKPKRPNRKRPNRYPHPDVGLNGNSDGSASSNVVQKPSKNQNNKQKRPQLSDSGSSSDNRRTQNQKKPKQKKKQKNRVQNRYGNDVNHRAQNKRRRNKQDRIEHGVNTYTKTQTVTRTQTPNDQPDVNCIYINKDTPTTQRPFWNILGRNANEQSTSNEKRFGPRKRAQLRFKASA